VRHARFILLSAAAFAVAAIPLGDIRAQESLIAEAAARQHPEACRGGGAATFETGRSRASQDGAQLAQSCPSPSCPAGRIPCAYQIRPNGCLSWRCCIPR
jgi:hypothetical protein